jgi:subfamily B ATP-binding cassette protein MsbA
MTKKSQVKVSRSETIALGKRLIMDFGLEHKAKFFIAIVCMLMVGVATGTIAWLSKSMVNKIFVNNDRVAVWMIGSAIMLAFLTKGLAGYFQTVLMGSIGSSITAKLQRLQFEKLIRMGVLDHSSRHPGGVVSKVIQSARAAKNAIITVTTNLVRDLFTVISLVVVMVLQDPFMSVFALLAAPLIIWGVYVVIKETKRLSQSEADMMAGLNVLGVEALQGLRVVKSFNLQRVMDKRIGSSVDKMENRQNRLLKVSSLTGPMFDILAGLIVGSFIFYAGWQTLDNGKTPGEFMAFITAFLLAYDPAKRLANLNVQLQREMVGVKRLFEVLDHGEVEQDETGTHLAVDGGRLQFASVGFSYKKASAPTLTDVTFDVLPGEHVAIVGRSGAGKSTIINLIMGMYRPSSGMILIDDQDISGSSLRSLRNAVAYVAQDTFLFSGSVRENVAFGKLDATEDEIVAALSAAQALEFVSELPRQLDTDVGNNGGNLSGGQRQRIAIARAFLKNAPVLLLDEATSALDGETEKNIKKALDRLSRGKTTLTVAHRLSTILDADKVILIDKGQIVAVGTHESLETESELYRKLFATHEIA